MGRGVCLFDGNYNKVVSTKKTDGLGAVLVGMGRRVDYGFRVILLGIVCAGPGNPAYQAVFIRAKLYHRKPVAFSGFDYDYHNGGCDFDHCRAFWRFYGYLSC
jgi:hypothetical protein